MFSQLGSFMDHNRYQQMSDYLDRFSGHKVLVIGDAMLDNYIWGETTRISPEAPVPVVGVKRESARLGGAANVADNIRALGGEPLLVAVIGDDEGGRQLREAFHRRGITDDHLVCDTTRPTVKKTRVIARNQQVVRIDREILGPLMTETVDKLSAKIEVVLPQVEGVLISDYGKGVIGNRLLERWLPAFRERKLPVCVDPKETHFHSYKQVTVLTPNAKEASFAAGQPITDSATLETAGRRLLESLQSDALLITRGEDGMSLMQDQTETIHIPSVGRHVYDVTGAGDTVVSTLAMALAAGVPLSAATELANHAAGRVIGELGTATASCEQILESIRHIDAKEPQ
jgi:rfaE bifunctional protein kinase chain/domain